MILLSCFPIQVLGLGPRLKLFGQLQNLAEEALEDISLCFLHDEDVYTIDTPYINVSYTQYSSIQIGTSPPGRILMEYV